MNSNFNPDSFKKGQQFESFVENVLFPKPDYDLLHKTSDIDQNELRFVENSLLADFKFRCKLTGKEFWVEAKYRSRAYKGAYEIASEKQRATFPEKETDEVPIICALGYGGKSHDPEFISLIPFRKFPNGSISTKQAMHYQVPRSAVKSSTIHELTSNIAHEKAKEENNNDLTQETFENKVSDSQAQRPGYSNVKASKSTSNYRKIGIATAVLLVAVLALIMWNAGAPSQEELLRERISNYYQTLDSNKVHEIREYISEDLHTWYSYTDPNLEMVISDVKRYRQKYPFTVSEVDWSNFSLTQLDNGHWKAKYPLEYRIKSKIKNPYKTYDLDITTVWDEDMMLVSATEVKR